MSNEDKRFEEKIKRSTTLDFTIVQENEPANIGSTGAYFKLTYGPGDKCIKRKDLLHNKRYPNYGFNPCNSCNLNHCKCKDKRDKRDKREKEENEERNFKLNRDKKCKKKRTHIATYVQVTDIHIIDSANPARVAFLGVFIPEVTSLADSFRSYEPFTCQVAECMVRKINAVEQGPHLKQKIQCVISTGDDADSEAFNELQNYINLLDGNIVVPIATGKYVGVQDDQPAPGYQYYYHPDCPPPDEQPDLYKIGLGYPNFPGILDEAAKPFCATGVKFPWYTCNGNHDSTKLGNYSLGYFKILTLFDQIAIGKIPDDLGSKLIQLMSVSQAELFVKSLVAQDAQGVLDIINQSVLRNVPCSRKRRQFMVADFIAAHFNTTEKPGPVGHGFSQFNIDKSVTYYTFKISDKLTGIMLDSTNVSGNLESFDLAPNGSLGRRELAWFEEELRKRHSTYYNSQGELVCTDNKDELIAVFCHHTIDTMNNIFTSPTTFDSDPQKITGQEFVQVLYRYPNVLYLQNGHLHLNRITPYINPSGKTPGFWEINTASHIDYPQQSRIVEVADNNDGTLSIFCTIINHQSPADAHRGCFSTGSNKNCSCSSNSNLSSSEECNEKEKYSIEEMASISRELALNDPFINPLFGDSVYREGTVLDRNVELIIPNPLLRCKPEKCNKTEK